MPEVLSQLGSIRGQRVNASDPQAFVRSRKKVRDKMSFKLQNGVGGGGRRSRRGVNLSNI